MKPPESPSRFQSNLRHYHRHQTDDPNAWDNWVKGPGSARARRKGVKWLGILIALLAFGGLIALLVYEMR